MLKIEQLYYLTQVAKYGSINKAAEHLYITSAAISKSIDHMEKECGYKLLERTYRGVKLTDKGKAVVKLAEQMLAIHDDILNLDCETCITEPVYNLVIDRSSLTLLSNKVIGPRSKVFDYFKVTETGSVGMNYYEKLKEDTVLLMVLMGNNRELFEKDDRIQIRYLYASKQYPVSSKNTKFIKENTKKISSEDLVKIPKIKMKSPFDIIDSNVVLSTENTAIYAEAIQNDYGVGLITKFGPDIVSFDSSNLKVYEPIDQEVYIVMCMRKQDDVSAMTLLEKLIKGN